MFDVPIWPAPIESVAVLPGPVPVPPRLTAGVTAVLASGPAVEAVSLLFTAFD